MYHKVEKAKFSVVLICMAEHEVFSYVQIQVVRLNVNILWFTQYLNSSNYFVAGCQHEP